MSDAIEKYVKAKRSGAYQHPESKKIYDEGPTTPPPGPADGPKKKVPVKTIGSIALALALFGSSGLMISQLFNPQTSEVADSEPDQSSGLDDIIRVIDDSTEMPELTPSGPDVPVIIDQPVRTVIKKVYVTPPAYIAEQKIALAKIQAWKEMTQQVIEEYFSRPVVPGNKRTLCITLDGQKHCRARFGGIDSELE